VVALVQKVVVTMVLPLQEQVMIGVVKANAILEQVVLLVIVKKMVFFTATLNLLIKEIL